MTEAATYAAQGFVRTPQVFTAGEVETFRAAVDAFGRNNYHHDRVGRWVEAWKRTAGATTEQFTSLVVDLQRCSPELWAAAADPRMVTLASAMAGAPCVAAAAVLIAKPPEHGQPFPLHQDSAYYGNKIGTYVIGALYLDAGTPENGPLRFLPGRWSSSLPHVSDRHTKAHLQPDQYRLDDTVEVCADAGDVVWFSHHTPHASYPNRSSEMRRVVRFGYVPAERAASTDSGAIKYEGDPR